jgi:DNA-binding transcriptional regulator YdaS (Cro superfamily)
MELPSTVERKRLAELAGVVEPYLYQCLTGRRQMGAVVAVQVEARTGGEIRRWDVCRASWHLIWPELIGSEGAPPVPAEEVRDAV